MLSDDNIGSMGAMKMEADKANELVKFIPLDRKKQEILKVTQRASNGEDVRYKVLNTLLEELQKSSNETEEHAERLKMLCLKLGSAMGLSNSELQDLSLFALLHDIGKIKVPQSILHKPGSLSPHEWQEIKKHPVTGCMIVKRTLKMDTIGHYVLAHHERWDGQGYPNRLAGDKIPLLCRILAVVDAYDAMTNDRVYRKGISQDDAVAELKRNAGSQFDSKVVDTFIRVLNQN